MAKSTIEQIKEAAEYADIHDVEVELVKQGFECRAVRGDKRVARIVGFSEINEKSIHNRLIEIIDECYMFIRD